MEFKLSSFRGIFEIWHQNYFGCINKIFVLNFRIPFWVTFIWKLAILPFTSCNEEKIPTRYVTEMLLMTLNCWIYRPIGRVVVRTGEVSDENIFTNIFGVEIFFVFECTWVQGLTLRRKNKQMTVKFENLPKSEEEKKCLFSRFWINFQVRGLKFVLIELGNNKLNRKYFGKNFSVQTWGEFYPRQLPPICWDPLLSSSLVSSVDWTLDIPVRSKQELRDNVQWSSPPPAGTSLCPCPSPVTIAGF